MVDDELVTLAKQGSQDAWAELYALHAGRLLVWLVTLTTGDTAAAAEDVAAESWLIASQKIAGFTGSSSEFAGWLFGIARKVNANGRRKTGRRLTSPHAVGPDDEALWGRTDGGLPCVEAMDFVRRTLAVLSPREAEVVACRDVVGLDVAGTAEALGIRPTAVRIAHHRAHKRLPGSLETGEADPIWARVTNRDVTISLAGDRKRGPSDPGQDIDPGSDRELGRIHVVSHLTRRTGDCGHRVARRCRSIRDGRRRDGVVPRLRP